MIKTIAPIMALLLSVCFMMTGHGLQTTILPIRADIESFDDIAFGVISSSFFAGSVLGCLFSPYVIIRAGHIRAFAALVSLASAATLAYIMSVDSVTWTIARCIFGFCIAGFYIIVESWLNERTSNDSRGLIMSIYIVINFLSLMLGQIIVTMSDHVSFMPFLISSVLVSIAVLPISLTSSSQPAPITIVRFRPLEIYKMSPVAFVGAFFIGIITGSLWSLAPFYAIRIGLSPENAAYYALVMILGSAITQWPLGRLSDKVDRRLILLFLCISAGALCTFTAVLTPTDPIVVLIFGCLIGMVTHPAYAVVFAHCYDQIDPEKTSYVEVASGMLLIFGLGSTSGPILASILINNFPYGGFYTFIGVCELILGLYLLMRIKMQSSQSTAEKTDWNLASTSPVGGVLTADPLDENDPGVIVPKSKFPAVEEPTEEEVAGVWETSAEELEKAMTSSWEEYNKDAEIEKSQYYVEQDSEEDKSEKKDGKNSGQ